MEFYVTLPSNVINQHINKLHDYVTTLPSCLQLDSSWKVGLCEIHYTNSWYNLKRNNKIELVDSGGNKIGPPMTLPAGRYTSISHLVHEISRRTLKSPGIDKLPVLGFDESSQKIRVRFGQLSDNQKSEVAYDFTPELSDMLGLTDGMIITNPENDLYKSVLSGGSETNETSDYWIANTWLDAKHSYDLTGGVHSIYVYSDVVDYSIVGNVRAQLLRVVKIPPGSVFGEPVHIIYERPYYLPLATKDVHSIEISLKDDSGEPIDFRFGRVEVTLHFIKNG